MAALTFTQSGDLYISTPVEVSGNFALHLESAKPGTYQLLQKSDSSATRAAITDIFNYRTEIDEQYSVLVPATIIVRSTVPITYGSITTA